MMSIGELAARTAVTAAALRMWEQRYGFPVPRRLPGGHRRYTEEDVLVIRAAKRYRDAGMRLGLAIQQARVGTITEPISVYGTLRRRHPGLPVQTLTKRTLMAMSQAIEDQCCATPSAGALYGAFEREEHYRASQARWTELARTSPAATVFADFATSDPAASPREVALPTDSPMRREWAVISGAAELPVALVAWEIAGQTAPDSQRLFESVWTVDPSAVHDAIQVCDMIARAGSASASDHSDSTTSEPATTSGPGSAPPRQPDLAAVSGLTNRIIAYVDRAHRDQSVGVE